MGKFVEVGGKIASFSYFEWSIPDFFALSTRFWVNEHINSPVFSCQNCKWNLRLYPKGQAKKGWISLFLEKKEADPEVDNLSFYLAVKKSSGALERTFSEWQPASATSNVWGYVEFLRESVLQYRKSELAPSDAVTFVCIMKLNNNSKEVFPSSTANMPQKESEESLQVFTELETLSSDFSRFFGSQEKCDVIVSVQDKKFQAHKSVLMARSPVFRAMFSHDTKEAQEGVVNEPDCDPDSFSVFLQYLYTGKFEDVQFKSAHQLYVTSDKYDTQKLKSFCSKYMERNLAKENVCEVADLGDRFEDAKLASAAQTFFNQNYTRIVQTEEWSHLMRKNWQLANSLLREMGKALQSKK